PNGSSRRRSRRRSPRPETVPEGNGWDSGQEQEIPRLPNRSNEQTMGPRRALHPQIPEENLHPASRHKDTDGQVPDLRSRSKTRQTSRFSRNCTHEIRKLSL